MFTPGGGSDFHAELDLGRGGGATMHDSYRRVGNIFIAHP